MSTYLLFTILLALSSTVSSEQFPSSPPYNTTIYPSIMPLNATSIECQPVRLVDVSITYTSDSSNSNAVVTTRATISSDALSMTPSFSPYTYFYSLYRQAGVCTGSLQLTMQLPDDMTNTTCTIVSNSVAIAACSSDTAVSLPINYNRTQTQPGFNSYSIELVRKNCEEPKGQTSYVFFLHQNESSALNPCNDVTTVLQPAVGPDILIPGVGVQGSNSNVTVLVNNTQPVVVSTDGQQGGGGLASVDSSGTATNNNGANHNSTNNGVSQNGVSGQTQSAADRMQLCNVAVFAMLSVVGCVSL